MKIQHLMRSLLVLPVLALPALAQEEHGEQGEHSEREEHAEHEHSSKSKHTPLHDHMEDFEEALETVEDYMEDFEGKAPMAALDQAAESVMACRKLTPRTVEKQPAEKRAEFVRNYRLELNKTLRALLDLEDAIVAGDKDAANAAFDRLEKLQKTNHRIYKPKKKRRRRRG